MSDRHQWTFEWRTEEAIAIYRIGPIMDFESPERYCHSSSQTPTTVIVSQRRSGGRQKMIKTPFVGAFDWLSLDSSNQSPAPLCCWCASIPRNKMYYTLSTVPLSLVQCYQGKSMFITFRWLCNNKHRQMFNYHHRSSLDWLNGWTQHSDPLGLFDR